MGTTPARWGENLQIIVIFLAAAIGLTPSVLPSASKSPLLERIWDKGQPWERLIFVANSMRGEAEGLSSTTGSESPRKSQ